MALPPLDPALRQRVLDDAYADIQSSYITLLATYPEGEDFPRLRGMGFVHDGWTFYMSTRTRYLKAREIAASPKVMILFTNNARRRDHFIQIDGFARRVVGDEFDLWQERRYVKEGDGLRRIAAGMQKDEWSGWVIDPIRVRANGYIDRSESRWSEAPVVFNRADLGLPPLEQP